MHAFKDKAHSGENQACGISDIALPHYILLPYILIIIPFLLFN
jgi:hypothetical protein